MFVYTLFKSTALLLYQHEVWSKVMALMAQEQIAKLIVDSNVIMMEVRTLFKNR